MAPDRDIPFGSRAPAGRRSRHDLPPGAPARSPRPSADGHLGSVALVGSPATRSSGSASSYGGPTTSHAARRRRTSSARSRTPSRDHRFAARDPDRQRGRGFQRATGFDPGNDDAKYNLELALGHTGRVGRWRARNGPRAGATPTRAPAREAAATRRQLTWSSCSCSGRGAVACLGMARPAPGVARVVRRGSRDSRALGLAHRSVGRACGARRARAVGVLLGLAAAEPVIERGHVRHVRAGAEALFVRRHVSLDARPAGRGSRPRAWSARRRARCAPRFARRRPVGLASLTDRTLPYLFPSARTGRVRIGSRPVDRDRGAGAVGGSTRAGATDLGALAVIPTHGYFPAVGATAARRRLMRRGSPVRIRVPPIGFGTPPAIPDDRDSLLGR